MSDGMSAVVVLLVMIVILLCNKQEERGKTVMWWMLCAGAYFLIKDVGPLAVAGAVWLFSKRELFFGSVAVLIGLGLAGFLVYLVYAAWIDEKDNHAIRRGSIEAFNRRVDALMTSHGYTKERATQAALRVRDGKRSIPIIPFFVTGIVLAIAVAVFDETARPYAIGAAFLGVDGFLAYAGIKGWNPADDRRQKLATILIVVSTSCGVLAFIVMCIRSGPSLPGGLLWAASILTFLIGFFQPKSDDAETENPPLETKRGQSA